MPIAESATLKELVVADVPELELVQALIKHRHGSLKAWAKLHGWYGEHVYATFAGDRAGEDVWNAVAAEFGVDRALLEEIRPARAVGAG